jgi:hypothetical protein
MISRGKDNRFAGSTILKRDTGRGHLARFHYQSHGNIWTRFGQILPQLRIVLEDHFTLPLRWSSKHMR